jgi:hypothetical protein
MNPRVHLIRATCSTNKYTRVNPKYSGLVPPSIQQFWKREALVYGRTTMSSEPVCLVARSWVDVGSVYTRLVVRFMIFRGSVRNIPNYIRQLSEL